MKTLQVLERENQRVMTTAVLAEEYETTERRISENFNANKERYIEGKHYYCLTGDSLREFRANTEITDLPTNINKLYLWTQKGALLHAKSLGTDRAWEVYDELVESYFRKQPKQNQIDISQLSPELQMFKQIFDSMAATQLEQKAQAKAIAQTNQRIDSIKDVVSLDATNWRNEVNNLINRIAKMQGGTHQIHSEIRRESYELLDKRFGVSVKTRQTNMWRRMADNGVCKSTRDKLSILDVIAEDKKLIEGYLAIVKDMAIKYGICDVYENDEVS